MKHLFFYFGMLLSVNISSLALCGNIEQSLSFQEYISPLGRAICLKDFKTAKKMIEYGADVNERSNGMTPLMIAARYNNIEILKLLLDKGARIKDIDKKGLTALKYAKLSNAKEAEEFLKAEIAKRQLFN